METFLMSALTWVLGIIFLHTMISSALNHSHVNTTVQEIHKTLIEINNKLAKNELVEENTNNEDTLDDYDEVCPGCGANLNKKDSECPDCGLKIID